ncbi:hypothetical protein NX059_011819 [Plenodomus lindquistii]|nr:hypothetical protein NX059_011819 [Plenodomus lindquistii]
MRSISNLPILTLAALGTTADAAMGPAFSTGPVGAGSWIRESTSTLILPKAPTNSTGLLSLWVGMGTSNGDLIQSIADNAGYDKEKNWGVFAYTLLSTSPTTQESVQTNRKYARPGDRVTMHYKFNDATGNYTQRVSVNGRQTAMLSTKDGHAMGWGSALECAAEDCGTVPAHKWVDTVIKLNTADPNYIRTMGKANGVTGKMSTRDGGVTWKVTDINIPAFTFGK